MTDLEQGDRVVLRGLVDPATLHLNGCHGSIALVQPVAGAGPTAARGGGGIVLAVHLDWLGKTFLIRPEHVVREDPILKYARQNCATVEDGVLEPIASAALGLPLMRAFAIVRWIVATQYLAKSTSSSSHQDYQKLTVQQVPSLPFQRSLELNAYAIQHWNDKYGVRDCLTSFVNHQPPPATTTSPQQNFTGEKRFIANALQSPRGMKAWHYGRQGEFWFVGRDYTGSFVVPDQNRALVYKIVGISRATTTTAVFKQPGEPVSLHVTPHCMPITIVPWFGRLLYDTTILVPPGRLKRADEPQLAHQLHETVLRAIQKSTAIEYFAELEATLPTDVPSARTADATTG